MLLHTTAKCRFWILTLGLTVGRVTTDINSHIYIVQHSLQFYSALSAPVSSQDFQRFRGNSHHDSTVEHNLVSIMQSME
jgi:hypothetical protein